LAGKQQIRKQVATVKNRWVCGEATARATRPMRAVSDYTSWYCRHSDSFSNIQR